MKWLFLTATLLTLPVRAESDFGHRFPAGSIREPAAAQQALKDADAEMVRIAQNAKLREAECYRGFFVNSCREDVRREKLLSEREVDRVRVEARDFGRRIEAERTAKRQAERAQARTTADTRRPAKEQAERAAAALRETEVKQRDAGESGSDAAVLKPGRDADAARPRGDRLTAAERAENVRKFQQKQDHARARAQESEAEQKQSAQRRAQKRKQIAQREAEREELRKRATEVIK